jgi:polysaccharide chain length determinant protein (PEP-CTERM system associated)
MNSLLPKLPRPIVRAVIGVWRRRWLVVIVAWIVALAGWFAIAAIPDMYESRAQVYINTDTALDTTINAVGARPNLEKGVRVIRTQLSSRDNLERVIYETGLDADIEGPIELERQIDKLAEQIKLVSEEEQYFVITYQDQDPVMAQRVVSVVLDLFIEQNRANAMADVDKALASLDREIEEREADLNAIDAEIATFRQQNADELAGADRIARQLENKDEQLDRIRDQISAADLRRQRLLATIAETPRYEAGSDLDAMKLQLATLQSQYNDNYPDIRRLKRQIAELESGSDLLPENREYTELERSLSATADEIRALRVRERRVEGELDELAVSVAQTPAAESELVALLRDRQQIERTYKQLTEERADMDVFANLNEAGGAVEYRRFEAPTVAAEPTWPPRGELAVAVALLAFGVGGALAFGLTQLDRTYTQAADLEDAFGLPVLGTVSPSPTLGSRLRRVVDRTAVAALAGGLLVAAASLYFFQTVGVSEEGPDRLAEVSRTEGGLR